VLTSMIWHVRKTQWHRVIATVIGAGLVGGLVPVSHAHAEGTFSAATNLASANVQIGAIEFDGFDCVPVPVVVNYSRLPSVTDEIDLIVSLDLRQPGSNTSVATYPRVMVGGNGTGQLNDSLSVCPNSYNERAGDYVLSGELYTYSMQDGSDMSVKFAPIELGVKKNPTKIMSVKVTKAAKGSTRVSGVATATTQTRGEVGASSKVTLSVKKPNSTRWRSFSPTNTDNFGRWNQDLGKIAKGSLIRIDVTDCLWCTDVQRIVKTR
jgi:hypothetical protein